MSEPTYHQAGLQHLARRQQETSEVQVTDIALRQSQTALAEAALEAHLVRHQQEAVTEIQDLERQRLGRLP